MSRMVSRRAARAAGGAAGAGAAGRGGVELLRASQPAGRALRLATSQNKHSNFQRTIHALAAKVRPQPRITRQEELQPVLHNSACSRFQRRSFSSLASSLLREVNS